MNGSTVGRPRAVTDAQIAIILAWHESVLAWKAQRAALKTLRQLAQELGLGRGTVTNVIRNGGVYKQPDPKARALVRAARDARVRGAR